MRLPTTKSKPLLEVAQKLHQDFLTNFFLDYIKINHHAECQYQRLLCLKVTVRTHTHTHTRIEPIALSGQQKLSVSSETESLRTAGRLGRVFVLEVIRVHGLDRTGCARRRVRGHVTTSGVCCIMDERESKERRARTHAHRTHAPRCAAPRRAARSTPACLPLLNQASPRRPEAQRL